MEKKMIVLKKDNDLTAPIQDFDKAQKLVNEGYEVWINKSGKKLVKQSPKKKTKKAEDK
tara:strand:+ start:7924 stop:8100 length:177 start_codon:yes stop_codon:yes gene_type:complete